MKILIFVLTYETKGAKIKNVASKMACNSTKIVEKWHEIITKKYQLKKI